MKKVKTIFLFILIVAGFLLAACQANYIRDVQGGTVAPSSSSERGSRFSRKDQRIFLRSFFSARNLLPCKRKNHLGRWFDRRLSQLGNCLTVVTGFRRAQQPNLSFQCSRTLAHTSRATACLAKQILCELPVTNGCCQWRFACFPGLDSSEQLPDKAQQSG